MPRLPLLVLLVVFTWTVLAQKRHWKRLTSRLEELEQRLQALEKGGCDRRVECPVGYLAYKQSCFLFVMGKDNQRNWMDAKKHCLGLGANLVTVSSPKQLRFLEKFLGGNFNISKTDLFTGLIATNSQAEQPFNPHAYSGGLRTKDSIRWTATRQAVIPRDAFVEPLKPHARFHPAIRGPDLEGHSYLSCVVLVWNPKARSRKERLFFMYGACYRKLPFVCEVKPPRWKHCRAPLKAGGRTKRAGGRIKRSTGDNPTLQRLPGANENSDGGNLVQETNEDDMDIDFSNDEDEEIDFESEGTNMYLFSKNSALEKETELQDQNDRSVIREVDTPGDLDTLENDNEHGNMDNSGDPVKDIGGTKGSVEVTEADGKHDTGRLQHSGV